MIPRGEGRRPARPGPALREIISRAPGCRIWLVDLDAARRRAAGPLPVGDLARLVRIRDPRERKRRRAAYAALRHLVARFAGRPAGSVAILRRGRGAPRLAGAPLVFSLSHSGGFALVALARRGSLGVDLEPARPIEMPAARRAQVAAAASALGPRSLDAASDEDLLQAWTRLEALAKATGDGIGATLMRLGVRAQPASQCTPRAEGWVPAIPIHDLRLPHGLKGALARGP